MAKKEFQAESKKLMDMMINSIYTNKEIFLRELISNASDAIDKLYYKSLTDTSVGMNKSDFRILITRDKENRILTVEEHNVLGGLGDAVASVIAESGKGCVFKKHGMQDTFATIGYAEDLYSYYQFDANGIVDKVREMMGMEFEPDENWDDE